MAGAFQQDAFEFDAFQMDEGDPMLPDSGDPRVFPFIANLGTMMNRS
jgi:hypothetical protein